MDAYNGHFTIGIPGNQGMPAVGKALSVDCQECGSKAGRPCLHKPMGYEGLDVILPSPHVIRARDARYAALMLGETMPKGETAMT